MDWKDIDLNTYEKIYEVTSNAFTPEEDKRLKVAAILNGITYEQMLEQPLTATTEMVNKIAFMFERPKPQGIRREYKLNGRKYTPFRDFSEMTTSQYIDYQAVMSETFEQHLADLMYIILVPKGHTYNDGYDRDEVMGDIGTLKVTEALGIADFFLKKYRRSLTQTLLYLKLEMRMAVMKAPRGMKEELRQEEKRLRKEIDELLSMYGSLSLKRLLG